MRQKPAAMHLSGVVFIAHVAAAFQTSTNCGHKAGGGGIVIVFNRLTIVCREGINITGKCVSPFREK